MFFNRRTSSFYATAHCDSQVWSKHFITLYFFFSWTTLLYVVLKLSREKAMPPHSSTLAWKIPWTEEPRRLQSMGSLRVGHDWATPLSLFTFMHWRRKWQPTPVFLPGESQGREPGGLLSVGSHIVGQDWSDLAAKAKFTFHNCLDLCLLK